MMPLARALAVLERLAPSVRDNEISEALRVACNWIRVDLSEPRRLPEKPTRFELEEDLRDMEADTE